MFTPDIRVCAVNGTNSISCVDNSRPRKPYFSFASTTIERPSGVSSASDESCAASAISASVTPGAGMKTAACRWPSVMVPVLSSSKVFTSPAASTARPDMASTLCWMSRSMPAIPIADSNPRQQPTERVGNQATQQQNQDEPRLRRAGIDGERLQGDHSQQKNDRQASQKNVQGDLDRKS